MKGKGEEEVLGCLILTEEKAGKGRSPAMAHNTTSRETTSVMLRRKKRKRQTRRALVEGLVGMIVGVCILCCD